MWLEATVLDRARPEHSQHRRAFCWSCCPRGPEAQQILDRVAGTSAHCGRKPKEVCTMGCQSRVTMAVIRHPRCYLFGDSLIQKSQTRHMWNEYLLWFPSYCKHSEISFQHLKNENSLKSSFFVCLFLLETSEDLAPPGLRSHIEHRPGAQNLPSPQNETMASVGQNPTGHCAQGLSCLIPVTSAFEWEQK